MGISVANIQRGIFYFLIFTFFILPEPVQKPFRIGLGLFFILYTGTLIYERRISFKKIFNILVISLSIGLIILNGGFQTSVINVLLCSFGVVGINAMNFKDHGESRIFNLLFYLSIVSMVGQLLFFRSIDGRPNLSYELNLSGAYLFLFFLLSNLKRKKIGIFFVIIASFLLLSRLLIFSIILFYILKFFKKILPKEIFKIKFTFVYLILTILFFVFNSWFLLNVEIESSYKTDSSRITEVNDGSNKLRFLVNMKVLEGLFVEKDSNLKFGYGQVSKGKNKKYEENYTIMPHNELLVSVVEFGYVFTIIVFFIILRNFNPYFNEEGMLIIFPLLLYSLILWVRFFLVPSFEMIFILFLLKMNEKK